MKAILAGLTAFFMSCTSWAAGSTIGLADKQPENTGREFIMSCTYGVLAGTFVGVASLAFTTQPAENLNRVARGASIGLYAGILLGLYVVYIVPGLEEEPPQPDEQIGKIQDRINFSITPLYREHLRASAELTGAQANYTVLRF